MLIWMEELWITLEDTDDVLICFKEMHQGPLPRNRNTDSLLCRKHSQGSGLVLREGDAKCSKTLGPYQ